MNDGPSNEQAMVDAARRIDSPEERAAYLKAVCGPDESLRHRVEVLLQAADATTARTASTATPALWLPREVLDSAAQSEKAGDTIGRYKLLQKIGEGGCGVVYMAEQEEPVRRRVALKVIKLGMDTRQVIARFEAERQALALMEHPNIAKVLDGGTTDSGRPYFVMELVRGVRITDYCDQHNLSTGDRLALFAQVCHAIQHAHQKGIIHRDIKPSNILVTLQEGTVVPKVIDFGIAKATEQRLTDKTLFTELGAFIGTPAYMSPEQAEMSSLDIDTRSDIYSLGVLLYELLTGQTPFDSKALLAAGLDEMRRQIREDDPPRPSTRLGTLAADEQTTVSRRRRSEPPKLISLLRGDLDWIVMKCLEKDRTRRYETANELSADVRRHLGNEPVLARPPGSLYRFRKMVRRNKLRILAWSGPALFIPLAVVFALEVFRSQIFFMEGPAYVARFKDVRDLTVGDSIKMNGVKIGRVEKIDLVRSEPGVWVQVTLKVRSRYGDMVKTDSVASIKSTGAKGQDYVFLKMGSPEAPGLVSGGHLNTVEEPSHTP